MAIAETARLIASLELDPRKFNAGVGSALGNLGRLDRGMGRVGKGVGQLGTGLAKAGVIIAGAAVTGIGAAAKAAIDFEDAFAGVKKTVSVQELEAAGLSFEGLATRFRTMATEMPIAATEFARIGELAGALGIRAGDIETFTKTVALLGVTTDLSSDAAGEALGKLGTILGLTGDDFTEFADALVNLGNKGASTESEIIETAKRFAGVGKQAGLTKEEILGLSSAITSLGAGPEAGGSALSRLFSNMGTEIANTTDKGQAFVDLTGHSFKELQKQINRGDSLGIFRDTIEGLDKLKTTTAKYKFLKELGITNVRDRDAIIKLANDTDVLDKALQDAKTSTGALGAEATKRFDTIRSKLTVLKNTAIEAGITVGTEMLPSIGRATDKLAAALRDPKFKGELKALGQDIGKFIDGIDWNGVLKGAREFWTILKQALGVAKGVFDVLNTLPTEIKAAGLGLIGLNKLSGGLIATGLGNIFGGLGESLTRGLLSKIPGIGKFAALPVYVTNMGVGGLGGTGGAVGAAKGGLSTLSKVFLVGEAIGLALLVKEVADNVTTAAHDQAVDIGKTLDASLAKPNTLPDLNTKLAGINAGIDQINAMGNIPAALFHDTLVELERQRTEVVAAIEAQTAADKTAREDTPVDEIVKAIKTDRKLDKNKDKTADLLRDVVKAVAKSAKEQPGDISKAEQKHFDRLRAKTEDNRIAIQTANKDITKAQNAARIVAAAAKAALLGSDRTSRSAIVGGGHSDKNSIVAAIYRNRPIVNVSVVASSYSTTTVVKSGGTTVKAGGKYGNKQIPDPYQ